MTTSTSRAPSPSPANEDGTVAQVKDSVGEVAGTAADEARHVADEAGEQVRSLAGSLRDQVEEQGQAGLDRLVSTVTRFAEDLDAMTGGRGGTDGMAADLLRQVSERARAWTTSVEGHSPGDLLATVEDFGRRRPGAFLLAAAASGAVVGRLTKGAMADRPGAAPVDLRDRATHRPATAAESGAGLPGASPSAMGGGGPGSLGASALEGDLWLEEGNAMRTGAGQGLRTEQGSAHRGPGSMSGSGSGAISSADDVPGGPVDFPVVDEAVEASGLGRVTGPEVQP